MKKAAPTKVTKPEQTKKKPITSSVDVYCRFRPLLGQEKVKIQGIADLSANSGAEGENSVPNTISLNATINARPKNFTFGPFKRIFTEDCKNKDVYENSLQKYVKSELGKTICFFCYGQSGSGKTHSIFGYGAEQGLFKFAIADILQAISQFPELSLSLRFAELYNNRIFDLNNSRAEIFIRDDEKGNTHLRSETIFDEKTGKVRVNPLKASCAKTLEDAVKILKDGIKQRAVGNSSVHAQSSRSHGMIEMEIVNEELLKIREEILVAESELVPVGKERDGYKIWAWSQMYEKTADGAYICHPNQKLEEEMARLDNEVGKYQQVIEEKREIEKQIIANDKTGFLCGTLVFVDLAGADYEDTEKDFTKEEIRESREINKSLLSLKECIRGIQMQNDHIPFRNSKLTMVLKRFLIASEARVLMLANCSECANHLNMTVNTLGYAELVALANSKK